MGPISNVGAFIFRLGNLAQVCALTAISPLVSFIVTGAVHQALTSSAAQLEALANDPISLVTASWTSAQEALLYCVVDAHMYGSWTFGLLTFAYWPLWLVFWSLPWTEPL